MRRLALLAVLLLCGCVYYNGMYNTKRLAGSARRAEREGRPFEANNLWGQVITRADSLVVRHPDSKYVEQALVYKGVALAKLGQCPAAVPPLVRAAVLELDGEIAEEASLALGRCQLELGDPGAAGLAFARVLRSDDEVRREEARLLYARALRQTGRPEDALALLHGATGERASGERLLAFAAAGRADATLALADSLLAVNDSARVWDSVLLVVGQANARIASALVDHLGRRSATPAPLHARRLLEDAERLERLDSARSEDRLRAAARVGRETGSGAQAELRLLRLEVRHVRGPGDLRPLLDTLQPLASPRSAAAQEAQLLAATLAALVAAADSSAGVPQGDLRLFLAAETARDSLGAPALAASLFRRLVESWPDSPYAPKALLAGRALDPAWGDEVQLLLEQRYAASPYLAFVRGEDAAGYRQLEDSLQTYALTRASAQVRRAPPGARPAPVPGARPGTGAGQRPTVPRRELEP